VADALNQLLNQVIRDKSRLAWGKLLSFSYWGLKRPNKDDETGKNVSLTSKVKFQVLAFMENENLPAPLTNHNTGRIKSKESELKKRVSAKLMDGDVKGAVRLLTSDEEQAPHDDRTFALLAEKHPPTPIDLSLPQPADNNFAPPVQVGEEEVRKALASFRPGSAGGPDGLRPCHLKALISRGAAESGVRLLATLTEFINLILRGEVPEFARMAFYGAVLFALNKTDGGVRPIAVGSTLRRLAAKVGARPVSSEIGESLRPIQLGYSSRGGCEAAAHAARRYLRDCTHKRVIFKVDMANAFNTLRRDVFLAVARERVPSLYRML
jgi:hypothetical protein